MFGVSSETACQRKKSLVLFLKAWWHYCDFPLRFALCFIKFFSALTVFNCLSHWKKKRGDSFNDRTAVHEIFKIKPLEPFFLNFWFVSQNICLFTWFLRLGFSETVLNVSHAYITDWCPYFWPNLGFGLSCNSSQLYLNVYSFWKEKGSCVGYLF